MLDGLTSAPLGNRSLRALTPFSSSLIRVIRVRYVKRLERRNATSGALAWAITSGGYYNSFNAIVLDSTYVYTAGSDSVYRQYDHDWRIEKRYRSDGSLVSAFGSGGGCRAGDLQQ